MQPPERDTLPATQTPQAVYASELMLVQSRHVATSSSELDQRVRTKRPPWQIVGMIACAAAILYLAQLPWTALVAPRANGALDGPRQWCW